MPASGISLVLRYPYQVLQVSQNRTLTSNDCLPYVESDLLTTVSDCFALRIKRITNTQYEWE